MTTPNKFKEYSLEVDLQDDKLLYTKTGNPTFAQKIVANMEIENMEKQSAYLYDLRGVYIGVLKQQMEFRQRIFRFLKQYLWITTVVIMYFSGFIIHSKSGNGIKELVTFIVAYIAQFTSCVIIILKYSFPTSLNDLINHIQTTQGNTR